MKYLNKSFSVSMFANRREDRGDCGHTSQVFITSIWGRLCVSCYNAAKNREQKKKIQESL